MVIGALEGERAQHALEGLGAAAGVAGRPTTVGAVAQRAAVVGAVGVEALLDGARGELQGAAADSGLDGLEVDGIVRAGADEAVDLGADVGCEALAQRFFFACSAASAVGAMRARQICSLIWTSSADRAWKRR